MLFRCKSADLSTVERLEPVSFCDIPFGSEGVGTELHLEELIASNTFLINEEESADDSNSLIIIGRQVRTSTGRRMDLVAMDDNGHLILIEVKRDPEDIRNREDNAEIQSVRYAASLAKLSTIDDLVSQLYGPYIAKYCEAELRVEGGTRNADEWARKKLLDFVKANRIDAEQLNSRQSIVLVGAAFDRDTKSAVAWLAQNQLPIRMIELRPTKCDSDYLLRVEQIIPVSEYSDFFVDVVKAGQKSSRSKTESETTRRSRPRMLDLLHAEKILLGDEIYFRSKPEDIARIKSYRECEYQGRTLTILEWAKEMSGWSAVNIYEWIHHVRSNKLLGELREQLENDSATN